MCEHKLQAWFSPSESRQPMRVSHGPVLMGAAMPHPDVRHGQTAAVGAAARFATLPPKSDPELVDQLRQFVAGWLRKHLLPLSNEDIPPFHEWLESTNYPRWRKRELTRIWEKLSVLGPKECRVKSFVKREVYPDWKHARAINARSDEVKVATGRVFKAVEKALFSLDYFIKKVPCADRPAFIQERLRRNGWKYIATDYTAFESLFTREIMKATEFQLYEYMLNNTSCWTSMRAFLDRVLAGINVCQFGEFTMNVAAKRMSGEMNTSLGNSFSNLMFFLFVCHLCGISEEEVAGVVEGDDGLFAIAKPIDVDLFTRLGLNIKLEEHEDLCTASFCGMVFDEHELCNITDPREVLATFGWYEPRYAGVSAEKAKALIRCKALSLAWAYPGCPVVAELAQYGLRVTQGVTKRALYKAAMAMDDWNRQWHIAAIEAGAPVKPVGRRTRLLVEQLYGLTVENQLRLEQYLRAKNDLGPINAPYVLDVLPDSWILYWHNYVRVGTGEAVLSVRLPGSRAAIQFREELGFIDHPVWGQVVGNKRMCQTTDFKWTQYD